MRKLATFAFAAAMLCLAGSAPAQLYVTGDFTTPSFSPGTGATPGTLAADMAGFDDGSHGDAVGGDGIFTTTVSGLTVGNTISWKWASTGFAQEVPNCGPPNSRAVVPASGTLVFTRTTNPTGNGFVPEAGTGNGVNGTGWNSSFPTFVAAATSIKAVGAFQANDFSIADADALTLTDTFGGDPAGDGIYKASVTGLAPGSYDFKIVFNGAFDNPADMTTGGWIGAGCGNLSMTSLDSNNIITVTLDANQARTRASNPAAVAGPPFYAQSTAWGTAYSSLEDMGDDDNGEYRKVYNVATAGDYTVRVRQGSGRPYPDSGEYPFTTTAANQDVLVVFDRTNHSDLYYPQTDIVAVVDAATKAPLNGWTYVQPVGAWQDEFGGSDYNAGQTAMQGFDDGVVATSGDVTAADGVFAVKLTAFAANTGQNTKAVAQRAGHSDTGFNIQLGGPLDGLTTSGNNSQSAISYANNDVVTFQMDTVTGRVGVGATVPTRAATLDPNAAASASAWDMYN